MRRNAHILILALILALLPLRSVASLMADSCAAQDPVAATQPADAHCSGSAVLVAAARAPQQGCTGERSIALVEPAVPNFIPDPLDPPPLPPSR